MRRDQSESYSAPSADNERAERAIRGLGQHPLTDDAARARAVLALSAAYREEGRSSTAARFAWLATVCAHDLSLGKWFESHLDALQILDEWADESGCEVAPVTDESEHPLWGVWAAEGPGSLVMHTTAGSAGGTRLAGRKSWCSAAAQAGAALVTATDESGESCLFAVALQHPGVTVTEEGWSAVGMRATRSVDVLFDRVPAVRVGPPGWYVQRRGFWHGAAGIAACWHGAACAVAMPLLQRVRQRSAPGVHSEDPLLQAHLGAVDAALASAQTCLRDAANRIDNDGIGGTMFARIDALRVRATVEAAAESVLLHTGRALGAAPLCRDASHAQRTADLAVFLRQSHAERDLSALGALTAHAPFSGDIAWMP